MIPGEADGVSDTNPEIGKEVPYGLVLAIMAKNMGIKNVAILSDISHHAGPIAWAMDNLMGEKTFVSCFNSKDWLSAAEKFCNINDSTAKSIEAISDRKVLVLAGCDDNYKKSLDEVLSSYFDIIFISHKNTSDLSGLISEKIPDVVILVGEIVDAKGIEKYSVKRVFNEVLSMKTSEQKILVLGYLECNHPSYLRLPVLHEDIVNKLS